MIALPVRSSPSLLARRHLRLRWRELRRCWIRSQGARQGNLNPMFYRLAATTSNGVFHDATPSSSGVNSCSTATPSMCNNSTPSASALTGGLAGYSLTTGYDLVTGLGSLDVANFFTAAAGSTTPMVTTTLSLTASANPITTTQTVSFTATLAYSNTSIPTGTVQFYSNGMALGSTVALSGSGKAATSALNFSTPGTYQITAVYSGDSTFTGSTSAALALVVTAPSSFTVAPAATSLSLTAGMSGTDSVTVASVNSFAGTVALSCSVTGGSAARSWLVYRQRQRYVGCGWEGDGGGHGFDYGTTSSPR